MPTKGKKSKRGSSNIIGSVYKRPDNGPPPSPSKDTGKVLPPAPPCPPNTRPKNKENVEVLGREPELKTVKPIIPPNSSMKAPRAKLLVQGPVSIMYPPIFSDPVLVDLFDLIGIRCRVWIENEVPEPSSLMVHGTHISDVRIAYNEIFKLIQRTGRQDRRAEFWIHSASGNCTMPWTSTDLASQLFHMARNQARERQSRCWGLTSALSRVAEFREHFIKVTDKIKAIPHRLHMKLELGTLFVDVISDYDAVASQGTGGLEAFLERESITGSTIFDTRIGDKTAFFDLQKMVIDADGNFYPCSSTVVELGDTQPRNYLIICTEAFLIEFIVEDCGLIETRFPKLSQMRVFQHRMTDCNVDMNVVCVNQHLDWKMHFVQEIDVADVSPAIRAIAGSITVNYTTGDEGFPVPATRPGLVLPNRIKRIIGKRTWAVGCKGTRYMLELALCREWPLPGDTNTHTWSTGISVHCDEWDEALDQNHGSGKPRHFGQNFSTLFPPAGTANGIGDFLSVVEGVCVLSETVLPAVDKSEYDDMGRLYPEKVTGKADSKIHRAKDLAIGTEEAPRRSELELVPEDMSEIGTWSGMNLTRSSAARTADVNAKDVAQCHVQLVDDLIVFD